MSALLLSISALSGCGKKNNGSESSTSGAASEGSSGGQSEGGTSETSEFVFDINEVIKNLQCIDTNASLSVKESLAMSGKYPTLKGISKDILSGVSTTCKMTIESSMEVNGKDSHVKNDMFFGLEMKLSEILAKDPDLEVEDLEKAFDVTITEEDQKNDVMKTIIMDENNEEFNKYDDNDQYLQYTNSSGGDMVAKYSLYDENEDLGLDEMKKLFLVTAENGTYDEKTSTIMLDVKDHQDLDFGQMSKEATFKTVGLKLDGNMPTKFIFEYEQSDDEIVIQSFKRTGIVLTDPTCSLEYDLFFNDLGNTTIKFPDIKDPACEKHPFTIVKELEDGHRDYCGHCFKYVSKLESHIEDETYGVCKRCGHISLKERTYSSKVVDEDSDYTTYAFSYQESATGAAYNLKILDYIMKTDADYSINYISEVNFTSNAMLRYYEGLKLLIVIGIINGEAKKIFDDACYYANYTTYSFYEVEVDTSDRNNWRVNGQSLEDADITPFETIKVCSVNEKHDTSSKNIKIDDCHSYQTYVCNDCEKTISAYDKIEHDFSEFTLITYEEMLEAVGQPAKDYTKPSNGTSCLKATCSRCGEDAYLYAGTSSHSHCREGGSGFQCFFKSGDGSWTYRYDYFEIPHMTDANGKCYLCDCYTLTVNGYDVEIEDGNPLAPYIYDQNAEYCNIDSRELRNDDGEFGYALLVVSNFEKAIIGYVKVYYGDADHKTASKIIFSFEGETGEIEFPDPIEIKYNFNL